MPPSIIFSQLFPSLPAPPSRVDHRLAPSTLSTGYRQIHPRCSWTPRDGPGDPCTAQSIRDDHELNSDSPTEHPKRLNLRPIPLSFSILPSLAILPIPPSSPFFIPPVPLHPNLPPCLTAYPPPRKRYENRKSSSDESRKGLLNIFGAGLFESGSDSRNTILYE
jgi:hypothetical protein